MEQDNKKRVTPEIDEEMMMSIMAGGIRKEGLKSPEEQPLPIEREKPASNAKERSRSKKAGEAEYKRIFFKRSEATARNGKTVYIHPDFHERLSRIVQVIGEDKISIYAYLNNLLEYHFQEFAEEITVSFNEKYKPIL